MKTFPSLLLPGLVLVFANALPASASVERTIAADELRDKINGFWLGQLAGNYVGFPRAGTLEIGSKPSAPAVRP
jgi:hypothetical protein